jgi:pyruvate/2-oxoglutarate dehydrogenase complex dihydrolipoamide dehydrogenase (E3) component
VTTPSSWRGTTTSPSRTSGRSAWSIRHADPVRVEGHGYTVVVNGDRNEDVAWYYPSPSKAAARIAGRVAFWRGVKVAPVSEDGAESGGWRKFLRRSAQPATTDFHSPPSRPEKMSKVKPDLVVIGGGSAGLGAARAARSKGASVLLVEQSGRIGGDCTFTGCVPSKTLIEAAARGATFTDAMAAARHVVDEIADTETAEVLRAEGIDVAQAEPTFTSPRSLHLDGRSVEVRAVVLATGARPAVPSIPGLDTVPVLTNETLFELDSLPASLAVLGGGPIGVEMAQAFARLGSAVTVVEATDRLLPREEPLASAVIREVFASSGITIRTGYAVARVERSDPGDSVRLHLEDGTAVEAEALLVAVGRTPSTAGLGLDTAGVKVDGQGFVQVDSRLRTTARGVFAAGDVAQRLQFTHVAYETGRIAALNALSRTVRRRFHTDAVPWVTFTSPEVARVGLTEAEAAALGGRVRWTEP